MFYTLIQEPIDGEYRSERFVCFEADSKEHAIERAECFGGWRVRMQTLSIGHVSERCWSVPVASTPISLCGTLQGILTPSGISLPCGISLVPTSPTPTEFSA